MFLYFLFKQEIASNILLEYNYVIILIHHMYFCIVLIILFLKEGFLCIKNIK
jgi:hypothetical protein